MNARQLSGWRRAVGALALAAAVLWCSSAAAQKWPSGRVDLHNHLFMKEALGVMFSGDFDEPLQASSWDDRLSSKVDARGLDDSGLGVVVVALFVHPLFAADLRQSLRDQLDRVDAFVRTHPHWAIARDPNELERILRSGRKALVLSLEGAAGVLETEEDLVEFVDQRGIRVVTLLHLVDDHLGGAANLDGFQHVGNPHRLAAQLLDPICQADGVERNPRGLTPSGERLAVELLRRHVWIDLSHASDAALQRLLPLIERSGQPPLFSHVPLRRFRPTERALSARTLARVAADGGLVGLIPSEDDFRSVEVPRSYCPDSCALERCQGSVHAFAMMFDEAATQMDPASLMLGSDFNGGMRHLARACGTGTSLDDEAGYWRVGQTGELYRAATSLGAKIPAAADNLRRYTQTWARVVAAAGPDEDADQGLPPLPPRSRMAGPSLAAEIGLGLGGGDPAGPSLWTEVDLAIRKDAGGRLEAEPVVRLLHLTAKGAFDPSRGEVAIGELRFSPIGIEASSRQGALGGEALRLRLARNDALDQRLSARAAALGGLLRTTPDALSAGDLLATFVTLEADALGYGYLAHRTGLSDLHGIYLGSGRLLLGASLFPANEVELRLVGGAGAGFSLVTSAPQVGYQADLDAFGGLELGVADRRFVHFLEAHLLANGEGHEVDRWLTAPQFRGGFRLGF